MYVNCILYHFTLLHALACKFYWKQQKQLVKTTSSFSPRNLAALLNRRACCPPQKKLFLSVVKVVSIYKTSPLYTLYMFYTANHSPLFSFRVFRVFRGSNHDTLRARGACNRIPHLGVSPPQQEPFITHVYRPHIIPKTPIFLYPPRRKQPQHKRIKRPPVCRYDVKKYSPI